jgi:CubicO group peptidase (beta-lactamase class C family)
VPGTRSEYHELTFGYLVGNVVKRVAGRSLGSYFREEIADPLGADFLIGFGPEHDSRCADLVGHPEFFNTRAWRAAEVPALNGHGSADGLARVYSALACDGELDGVRLMRADTIAAATVEQPPSGGPDTEMLGLGYQLLWKRFPGLANTRAFGHFGTGGSIGLADPVNRLAIGYVRNQMEGGGAATELLTATYISFLTKLDTSTRPDPPAGDTSTR